MTERILKKIKIDLDGSISFPSEFSRSNVRGIPLGSPQLVRFGPEERFSIDFAGGREAVQKSYQTRNEISKIIQAAPEKANAYDFSEQKIGDSDYLLAIQYYQLSFEPQLSTKIS